MDMFTWSDEVCGEEKAKNTREEKGKDVLTMYGTVGERIRFN